MDRSRISTRSFSLTNQQRVLSDPSLSFNRPQLTAASCHQHNNSDFISTRYVYDTLPAADASC